MVNQVTLKNSVSQMILATLYKLVFLVNKVKWVNIVNLKILRNCNSD